MDYDGIETRRLLAMIASIMDELRQRGVVRSSNNPVADYAEALIAVALGLKLERKSTTGFDARDPYGKRYEVKARRITASNPSRQLSAIRGLQAAHFDVLAAIIFEADFTVRRACLIPHGAIGRLAVYRTHVNAWTVILRDSFWSEPEVEDISAAVARAQETLETDPNRLYLTQPAPAQEAAPLAVTPSNDGRSGTGPGWSPGRADAGRTDVHNLLNKIGKAVFVHYYASFRDFSMRNEEIAAMLPPSYTPESRRTRTSKAQRIIRENLQIEALRIILQSGRLDADTLDAARKILAAELNPRVA